MNKLQKELAESKRREKELACLLDECHMALVIVSTGIWRKEEMNACGLSGESLTVHVVEDCLDKIEKYIEGKNAT